MSQFYGRVHIKVKEPQVWERFKEIYDADFNLAKLASTNETSFIFDDEWSVSGIRLEEFVRAWAKILGEDGIIIADTININVDPHIYCVFYLGEMTRVGGFFKYRDRKKAETMRAIPIGNIKWWLEYGKFKIYQKEKKVIYNVEVSNMLGSNRGFAENINLPDKIYLRGTVLVNRPNNIETLAVSEKVSIVQSNSKYDATRLEVKNDNGSLGYVPSEISDSITSLISIDMIEFNAKVVEVVPLSQRNKHAKSPIVAISIEI